MVRQRRHRYWRPLLAAGFALLVAFGATPGAAAVAILSEEGAPALVLVDADRLDTPLLARLVAAGFGSGHLFETGCEVTDAALLADRLGRTQHLVALLSPGDASLVQELLRGLGGSLRVDAASDAVPADAPLELVALRDALGEAARGLKALDGRLGR